MEKIDNMPAYENEKHCKFVFCKVDTLTFPTIRNAFLYFMKRKYSVFVTN